MTRLLLSLLMMEMATLSGCGGSGPDDAAHSDAQGVREDSTPRKVEAGDAAAAGPWEFKVLAFERKDRFERKHQINPVALTAAPGQKVAVLTVRFRRRRGYTDAETAEMGKLLSGDNKPYVGVGIDLFGLSDRDPILIISSFTLRSGVTAPEKAAIMLAPCQAFIVHDAEVFGAFDGQGQPVAMYPRSDVIQFDATMVFACDPTNPHPFLFFQPVPSLDDIWAARLELVEGDRIKSVFYGKLVGKGSNRDVQQPLLN